MSQPNPPTVQPLDTPTPSEMSRFEGFIEWLLNLLDKDRPCNQAYSKAFELSNPSETPKETMERTKESLQYYAHALDNCRSKNPQKHDIHISYALALFTCFQQDGSKTTIDKAILQMKEAESCWPAVEKADSDYVEFQTNLGNIYVDRYMAFNSLSDLGDALKASEVALENCTSSSPRAHALALLLRGRTLCVQNKFIPPASHYSLDQPIQDLIEAVQICDQDVNDPHLKGILRSNLVIAHTHRYNTSHNAADLDQAIKHGDEAVRFLIGHPDRPSCLTNLAEACVLRYNVEKEVTSYKAPQAVKYLRKAKTLINDASDTGDQTIRDDCARLMERIRSFDDQNSMQVLGSTLISPAGPPDSTMVNPPILISEEPEPQSSCD